VNIRPQLKRYISAVYFLTDARQVLCSALLIKFWINYNALFFMSSLITMRFVGLTLNVVTESLSNFGVSS